MDTPPGPFFHQWKNVSTLTLLCLSLCFCSCRSRPAAPRAPDHAFYYWRSVFSLTFLEKQSLQALHVNKLYVKFFDVAWDPATEQAKPIAILGIRDTSFYHFKVTPVVFITNETLLLIDTLSIAPLAASIVDLITQLQQRGHLPSPNEIQLDCDWTAATKDRYFALIRAVRGWLDTHQQKTCSLSATIRLYQCKYREKTGVPPVDKGLLMCYNMGRLKDPNARNSILDPGELNKYTSHLSSYPLTLDVAFPIFDWKVLFHDQKYAGLIEDLPASTLHNCPAVRIDKDNYYSFLRDTSLENYTFQAGDRLRDEQSDYTAVSDAAALISRQLKNPPSTVILYHLAPANLSKYSTHELENIFNRFD
jgi:hypothetical protein